MPLCDHFHPPLSSRRHWHSFPNAWATYIAADLNHRLPPGLFAEANVQFGIEIDVAAFEEATPGAASGNGPGGATPATWAPPTPSQTVPIVLIGDTVEVLIYANEGGPTLAGAVELVSPANKDRAAHRDAFVSKCAAYVQQAVGLVVVDVVTERRGNLHDELMVRLAQGEAVPLQADLYAVAYRPAERDGQASLELWPEVLAVGRPLPTLPLWLRRGPSLPLDLEATYEHTCREYRLPVNGA